MSGLGPGSAVRLVAVGLLHRFTDDQGELFLVARRRKDAHLGGQLELPGGRVEAGETPESALIRELSEELGLSFDDKVPMTPVTFSFHRYSDRTVLLLFFAVPYRASMGQPQALASDSIAWISRAELIASPMPDGNRPLVAALAAGWPAPPSTK